MAKRRKITKAQAEKVAKMRAFLETERLGIMIETEATHITCIKSTFQNITGFYIMGLGSTGDRMTFAEIHKVYTAALKDKDFKAFAEAYGTLKEAGTSSKGPVEGKEALNSKETAQAGNKGRPE